MEEGKRDGLKKKIQIWEGLYVLWYLKITTALATTDSSVLQGKSPPAPSKWRKGTPSEKPLTKAKDMQNKQNNHDRERRPADSLALFSPPPAAGTSDNVNS